MTIEVEMKFKLRDPERIEFYLIENKAELIEIINQRDHYYNHPSRDFAKTDEAFRIREEGNQIKLTYKGPKFDIETKTRDEIELEIKDCNKMAKILELLGFQKVLTVSKERKMYQYNDILFCLDFIDSLGNFLELEKAVDDKKLIEKAKKHIYQELEKLGIDTRETIRESYLELLLNKK